MRAVLGRVVVGALLVAPAVVVGGSPATAQAETETWLSWSSQSGDYIGQGRSGRLDGPGSFRIDGTAGHVHVGVDTGTEWWDVTLTAPIGQQLTTGVYTGVERATFNTTTAGLEVTSTGRGCNTVTGSFTVHAISADTSGRITSLDASFTQHCEGAAAALTGTVKYAAPYVVPIVLTSSNPSVVADQAVTLTARVAPGTGPVTFLDGTTVIGQASPDAASLARFTTDRLTTGSHWLYARQGTATSARLDQVVAPASTSLWFRSSWGEWVGQGATASYTAPDATLTASGNASVATVRVQTADPSEYWTVEVAAPPGEDLVPGRTYTGVERAPFRSPGHAGLEVYGSGRGCNTVRGELTVHQVSEHADGSIATLDASFTQICGNDVTSPLRGRVRVGASALATSTTSLVATHAGGGTVDLVATVAGSAGPVTGSVAFTEGTRSLGTVAVGPDGRAGLTTTLSPGQHTVTARYAGSASYAASQADASVTVPAAAPTTTALTVSRDTVKAGRTVTFTVTVSGGTAATTGTVGLYDGVEPVGSATLSGGRATMVWTGVGRGLHTFTARYAGDAGHAPSVSPEVRVRVN